LRSKTLNRQTKRLRFVRYDESRVALCLSLKSNGDFEVVMSKADAGKLAEALKRVLSQA
jgi:hypothetical protein